MKGLVKRCLWAELWPVGGQWKPLVVDRVPPAREVDLARLGARRTKRNVGPAEADEEAGAADTETAIEGDTDT